ncbi:MAG TPA: LPS assembly lipoprotein LptE [Hyphomicrobiaceae bacterium]|nr:LPS assembly lipoprotein LptE [Hyphomicrobiaceae bacterium]
MSSHRSDLASVPTFRRQAPFGVCLIVCVAAALTACGDGGFRPLYAPSGMGGGVSERMKEVDFAPIPGRVGQRIRNDLIFESTGGGYPAPPQYRFEVVLKEDVTSTLVNISGQVSGAVYSAQASFRLIDAREKKVVFQGTSYARAPFERFESIYSNVRAREDAENRAARTIAEDLKTRLAAYLSRPRA